jgi:peptidoglycan/LPS O-acetylase OafA/YrhL
MNYKVEASAADCSDDRQAVGLSPGQLSRAKSRANGWGQLDTLRLILALVVAIAHANYIFFTPLGYVTYFAALRSLSYYAVLSFFVISGMVIGRSLLTRRDGFLAYIQRRIWRIYPPLVAIFLFMVLLDVTLDWLSIAKQVPVDSTPLEGGFDFDLRRAAICLLTFGFRGWLASGANGSLWSLAIEMRCYIAIGIIAQIFLGKTIMLRMGSALLAVLILREIVEDGRFLEFAPCYLCFVFGAGLSIIFDRLPTVLPTVPVDISYSLYIVHFPIMMAVFLSFHQEAPNSIFKSVLFFFATILASIVVSIVSANTIEKIRPKSVKPTEILVTLFRRYGSGY